METKTSINWWSELSELWQNTLKVHQEFLENNICFEQLLATQENYDCFAAFQNILGRTFQPELVQVNFEKLLELDFLWLTYLKIGALNPVEFLPNIQAIRLYWMFTVPDIQPLSTLKKLKYLEMVSGDIKDLTPLQELENLEILNCGAQEKITNLKPIGGLTNLKELYLGHTSVKNLKPIQNLKKLEKLSLYDNKVTDVGTLSEMDNLSFLDLQYTKVSSIQNLPQSLKQIRCGTTYISKDEMKAFLEKHPDCKVNDGEDYWKLNEEEKKINVAPFIFKASVTFMDLDNVEAISFAGIENEDLYLTIQCTKGESDDHLELNSQAYGTYNGVEKITLKAFCLTLELNESGKIALGYSPISIDLETTDDELKTLKKGLKKIFKTKFVVE